MFLKTLQKALKCHKTMYYDGLNLARKEKVNTAVVEAALSELKECLKQGVSLAQTKKRISVCFDSWVPENLIKVSDDAERNRAEEEVLRIVDYIHEQGLDAYDIETDINIKIPVRLTIGDTEITEITDKVDVIFRKGGIQRIVTFCFGEQPYSKLQRYPSYVGNSIELAVRYKFFGATESSLELWYLTGKDEKASAALPAFEWKEGKNIATHSFQSEAEADSCITRYMGAGEDPDCKRCKYAPECKAQTFRDIRTMTGKKGLAGKEARFTEEQRAVVEHKDGPAVVIAIPGSGKTFTLSHRFRKLVDSGVAPEKILCITFTASAAKEMEEKIRAVTGIQSELSITTFNAFGYSILKEFPFLVGHRVKVASETDKKKLIIRALDDCPEIKGVAQTNPRGEFGLVQTFVSKWLRVIEDDGVDAFLNRFEGKTDTAGILRVYDRYQELLKEGGYITFDEQVSLVNALFAKSPALAKVLSKRYEYIMVDEYQDTCLEQKEMIYRIAKNHNNIYVVGDDDQAIYPFRGGTNEYLRRFPVDFPEAKLFKLTENFRSNGNILKVANAIIEDDEERYPKELRTGIEAKNRPMYVSGDMSSVTEYVKAFLSHGFNPNDVCVLAKKNSDLSKIQECLRAEGIKATNPKDRLVDDPVFNVMIHLLNLCVDMDNDVSLSIVLKWFDVPLPEKAKDTSLYLTLLQNKLVEPYEDYQFVKNENLGLLKNDITKVMHRIYGARYVFEGEWSMADAISYAGLMLLVPDNYMVLEEIKEIADLEAVASGAELCDLMATMVEFGDTKRVIYDVGVDEVRLVTEHDSKGHEYPVVIIYGTEEFDLTKADDKRLMYVAVTRAQKALVMIENKFSKEAFNGFDRIKPYVVTV